MCGNHPLPVPWQVTQQMTRYVAINFNHGHSIIKEASEDNPEILLKVLHKWPEAKSFTYFSSPYSLEKLQNLGGYTLYDAKTCHIGHDFPIAALTKEGFDPSKTPTWDLSDPMIYLKGRNYINRFSFDQDGRVQTVERKDMVLTPRELGLKPVTPSKEQIAKYLANTPKEKLDTIALNMANIKAKAAEQGK